MSLGISAYRKTALAIILNANNALRKNFFFILALTSSLWANSLFFVPCETYKVSHRTFSAILIRLEALKEYLSSVPKSAFSRGKFTIFFLLFVPRDLRVS